MGSIKVFWLFFFFEFWDEEIVHEFGNHVESIKHSVIGFANKDCILTIEKNEKNI